MKKPILLKPIMTKAKEVCNNMDMKIDNEPSYDHCQEDVLKEEYEWTMKNENDDE